MSNIKTKNSMKNSVLNVTGYMINILVNFIVRSFFIRALSKEYLGINGLFTNILSVLSLAEMGIGNAIVFYLYKPIVDNDNDRINSIVTYFRKIYLFIASLTLSIGLIILPFLRYLIKDKPDVPENLNIIYLLYLLNSVVSYLVIYKKSLIIAHQKEYIATLIGHIFTILMAIVQVLILLLTRNFMLFLIVQIFFTIGKNISISVCANLLYPYVKVKSQSIIGIEERRSFYRDIKALFLYRIASLVVNSTDNIVLSTFVGIEAVGLYSNYYLIIHSIYMIIRLSITSISSSIGNFNITADDDRKYLLYKSVNLISFILFGYGSIMLVIFLNPFIEFWIGSEYLLSMNIIFVLVVNFYLMGISGIFNILRNTFGLFVEGQLRPLLGSIINIVLSIILVQIFGMIGVFIGTMVSFLSINIWYDPYIVHKHVFKKSPKEFYLLIIKMTVLTTILAFIMYYINNHVFKVQPTLVHLIGCAIISSLLVLIVYIIFIVKTKEFNFIYKRISALFTK